MSPDYLQPAPPRLRPGDIPIVVPGVHDPLAGQKAVIPKPDLSLRERAMVWFITRKINHTLKEGNMPQIIKNIWQSKGSTLIGAALGILTGLQGQFPGAHWVGVAIAVIMALQNEHGTRTATS